MTKTHRSITRTEGSSPQSRGARQREAMAYQQNAGLILPVNFLLTCDDNTLASHELALLAELSDRRADLHVLLDRIIDTSSQVSVVRWFRKTDRQALKHAIENEESPVEWAQRMVRDGQRTEEELIPLPALEPGAAHLAAATRYQERNIAEGKCSRCPKPLDRNSVRFCTEHLRKARDRQRSKKGPRSEPGSAEYLYSGEVTPSTHGRQPGSLTSLALGREKQTRRILAEMGVPPESAATARHAIQAAILKFLPTSEAVAIKEDDLFAMLDVSSRGTARNALMDLLKAGKIRRTGGGVAGNPFLYFKRGE
jgi:hypothetical protein